MSRMNLDAASEVLVSDEFYAALPDYFADIRTNKSFEFMLGPIERGMCIKL